MTNYRRYRSLESKGIDLLELLAGDRTLGSEEFADIVNKVQEVGDELYSDLLHLLSHHRFDEGHAHQLWRGILKHKRRLEAKIGRDPGVRVAALDYLTNVRGLIHRPRIVDHGDFEELLGHVDTDELTGLYSRRHTRAAYQREMRRARRYAKPLSVLLIDIDNFKAVNDGHGHAAGDQVLMSLAETLREVCRETDTIGRLGGDEILVILPEAKKADAHALAERIRCAARDRRVPVSADGADTVGYSISIGVATYPEDGQQRAELLEHADEALYDSKRRGRDVVSLYERRPRGPAPGDDPAGEGAGGAAGATGS